MWWFFGILLLLIAIFTISSRLSRKTVVGTENNAMADESAKLAQAQRALFASEQRLSRLRDSLALVRTDIEELKAKALSASSEPEALLIATELVQKESEEVDIRSKIDRSVRNHSEVQAVVGRYEARIRQLRDDKEQLSVERDLAEAKRDAHGLAADLNLGLGVARTIGQQRDEILALDAEAEIDRRLTTDTAVVSPVDRLRALRGERSA